MNNESVQSADNQKSPVEIKSVSEFVARVNEVVSSKDTSEKGSRFLFRGQPDVSYELLPSIGRGGIRTSCTREDVVGLDSRLAKERDYIETACHRLPGTFNSEMRPLDLLARLQHYGIPTRLLDVTSNALAALFFACQGVKNGKDGEVFIFCCSDLDRTDYPLSQAIADSWRLLASTKLVGSFFSQAIRKSYFDYQRDSVMRNYPNDDAGAHWIQQCCGKVMFVHASVALSRQNAQSAEYILFPNSIKDGSNGMEFEERILALPKDDGNLVKIRLVVPSNVKKSILSELRLLGVSRVSLFPDSIDEVCRDICDSVDGMA